MLIKFFSLALAFSINGHASESIPGLSGSHHYVLNSIFLKAPNISEKSNALIIILHGAPLLAQEAKDFSLESLVPLGYEFNHLGFNVVLFERRGFGKSVEPYAEETGPCSHKDYEKSLTATNEDLWAVLEKYKSYKIILVGHSAGGFAAVHLADLRAPLKASLVLRDCEEVMDTAACAIGRS